MLTDLIIVGAGGTAREVLAWLDDLNQPTPRYRCIGLLDDNPGLQGTLVAGVPVLGPIVTPSRWPHAQFIDALGGPRSFRGRPEAVGRLRVGDDRFATLVHPAAYVSSRCTVGRGCLIFPHATIGAHVMLGRHVVVLPGAVINHDARIGEFTIVASGANIAGDVTIGMACYIGMGSAIIQGTAIGPGALIGMGAVVRDEVLSGCVVVGNPARVLRATADRE
jgi:sugar O-acyltransferase (sialic acid O-acetyltransferase NeuD family)